MATPIGMMLDQAKEEIGIFIRSIMESNRIPADLMIYVLDSLENELCKEKHIVDAKRYTELLKQMEADKEGDEK